MILIILPVGCVLLSSVFCLLLPPPPLLLLQRFSLGNEKAKNRESNTKSLSFKAEQRKEGSLPSLLRKSSTVITSLSPPRQTEETFCRRQVLSSTQVSCRHMNNSNNNLPKYPCLFHYFPKYPSLKPLSFYLS